MTSTSNPTAFADVDWLGQSAIVALELVRLFRRCSSGADPTVLACEELAVIAGNDELVLADHSAVKAFMDEGQPFEVARCMAIADVIAVAQRHAQVALLHAGNNERRAVRPILIGVLQALDRAAWSACFAVQTGEETTFPAFSAVGALQGIYDARAASKSNRWRVPS